MPTFNDARIRFSNDRPINPAGQYVLYWCQMYRRFDRNHALDEAIAQARALKKPLVVYEGLKLNYPWASARMHQFMLEGMAESAKRAKELGIHYWPFVETPEHNGHRLLRTLCEKACLLVTDDYPQFIVPAQIRAIAAKVEIAVWAIDGNSLVPLKLLGAPTAAAAHLRPKIRKQFAEAWNNRAIAEPDFDGVRGPKSIKPPFETWKPPTDLAKFVKELPIDQTVPAVPEAIGGSSEGRKVLAAFLKSKLQRYADERSLPDDPARNPASGISPHLRHGHISIQEVVERTLGDDWTTDEINPQARGRDDYFCRDANVNSFLDEAITWRDVGLQWNCSRSFQCSVFSVQENKSWQTAGEQPSFNFESFDFSPLSKRGTLAAVLPPWAMATLNKHTSDAREFVYSLEEFENADTHDPLWNAAQKELVATGRIHNYLRMLWGKKVLEWSQTPEEAYRVLEHLNNKYALDGRDPNSYTGILWCFGLFDRPWPPERKVFGNIRFMSSANTGKKFKLKGYMEYIERLKGKKSSSQFD
jgi:deoxyribodipyrimidine photo-lyase